MLAVHKRACTPSGFAKRGFRLSEANQKRFDFRAVHALVIKRVLKVKNIVHNIVSPVKLLASTATKGLVQAMGTTFDDSIQKIAQRLATVLAFKLADSAGSNLARMRVVAASYQQLRAALAVVGLRVCLALFFVPCCLHLQQSIQDDLSEMTKTLDPMYCLCALWSQSDCRDRLATAVIDLVSDAEVVRGTEADIQQHRFHHLHLAELCFPTIDFDKAMQNPYDPSAYRGGGKRRYKERRIVAHVVKATTGRCKRGLKATCS